MTFDQSESEIQAHIDGPVQTAWDWLDAAIGTRDHETLWDLTDPAWKNVRARAWLSSQAEGARDEAEIAEIAAQLVDGVAPQSLWGRFAASELDYYAQLFGQFDLDRMGAGSRPRVVAPDYEIVVLAQLGTQMVVFTEPTEVFGIDFLMHFTTGRWLVAEPNHQR